MGLEEAEALLKHKCEGKNVVEKSYSGGFITPLYKWMLS